MVSRRNFLWGLAALPVVAQLPASASLSDDRVAVAIAAYLERHRKSTGGYGWISAHQAHVTPTFAVVGCYRLLGLAVPNAEAVGEFVRNHYPLPEQRRTVRPMRVFDYQQIQTLLWLHQSVESFRASAATWNQPSSYQKYYEKDDYPVLQHQALTLRARVLVGVEPQPAEPAWRNYFQERRRLNGTYNNTPAIDGTDGHLMNTLWANWALRAMQENSSLQPQTIAWIQNCQLPSGGFTYAPTPSVGGLDNIIYTWAALYLLTGANQPIPNREKCIRWLQSLLTTQWGFQGRPDSEPNPMATYYALDALRLLNSKAEVPSRRAPAIRRAAIPSDFQVFTAQIEAPGNGSPSEAVYLADKLGIHLWTAKNSPPGWLPEVQRVADARKVGTLFAVGNEEYGAFVTIPGLGTYSHLDDMVAPPGNTLGPFPPVKNAVYPWAQFRDTRLRKIRQANGRMVWQFNENEELSRILLDEAIVKGTYGAISAFHFGRGNFLEYEPFLMSYAGRIGMVGLQDAHGDESWWWADSLASFRTLFLARDATWQSFVQAIDRRHIMAIRHDRFTNEETEFTGARPEVRDFVMSRRDRWCWWGKAGAKRQLPLAVLTVLKPGMLFEKACPASGIALRLRLAYAPENPSRGIQTDPVSELISMRVDGKTVQPKLVSTRHDTYYIYEIGESAARSASAVVRSLRSGEVTTLAVNLRS